MNPKRIVEAANIAISNLLPTKSRSLYDIAYNRFKKWCAEKNVQVYSENVLLAYFSENAKNYKSSTLWAQYSIVKSCLIIYDNIDISKFPKLIAFLKRTANLEIDVAKFGRALQVRFAYPKLRNGPTMNLGTVKNPQVPSRSRQM
ncbi:hypothetical protein NQ317_006959 [Molorchus minor]|uniref:Uncharacterized protein n=1 Tax=Molorchus minor TaxID=1323400 RepID=A0ABQ9JYG9_9CUCU|nr:hypothetical protein NQ317_006959 [Molorchus minor]